MENNEELKQEQIVEESVDETIDPEAIVIEEDDDEDMPEPETKSYDDTKYVLCTDKFMNLFLETVGSLPYATVLKNQEGDQIKLVDLVRYVESKRNRIALNEMNRIISFIANLDFKHARPLMEIVENKSAHRELWELVE